MTLLSRKAEYALLILSYLYQKTESSNAREIADQFQLSRAFVANILKELCHAGFVSSTRGMKGGYLLEASVGKVSLAKLLESIQEGFQLTLCSNHGTHAGSACDVESVCTVKAPMHAIHQRILGVLRGVTLAEVFSPASFPHLQPILTVLSRTENAEVKSSPA